MHRRLRFILPFVMVMVTIAMTISNFSRPGGYLRPWSRNTSSWEAPDRQICDGLNAPATLIRTLLLKCADTWLHDPQADFMLETIVYFSLVGVLWYLVAIKISPSSLGWGGSLTFKVEVRKSIDVIFILFGLALGVCAWFVRHQFGHTTLYSSLISLPYLVWALILIFFYGKDLWLIARRI